MDRVGGEDAKSLPHPDEDWALFASTLKAKSAAESPVWDPLTKQPKEWVNIKKLQEVYGQSNSSATCVVS